MVANVPIKFGLDQMNTVGGASGILEFAAPCGSVLTKISNCHIIVYNLADRSKVITCISL